MANHKDMMPGDSVKAAPAARLVAVIASEEDLARALRLRQPPDLFEVRLDALHPVVSTIEKRIGLLARPLIFTARHPREGAIQPLSLSQRRALLRRFLSRAWALDFELHSCSALLPLWQAKAQRPKLILSAHIMERLPTARELEQCVARALHYRADYFKIVARTDTPAELAQLIAFYDANRSRLPLSVMGVGKKGRESRVAFLLRGSALNYVHLGNAAVTGQLSLAAARRVLQR